VPSCDSPTDDAPPRLAISACLLGHAVRCDGGHERDDSLVADLGRHVEWVPVCPEVELGLGVPRETIRLELHDDGLHLVAPESGADHTRAMRRFAIARVPVHRRAGARTARTGRGAFASALLHALPLLPVEEEGRLADPHRRGLTPLAVSRALLRRHAREIGDPPLEGQVRLLPPPRERPLRGSV